MDDFLKNDWTRLFLPPLSQILQASKKALVSLLKNPLKNFLSHPPHKSWFSSSNGAQLIIAAAYLAPTPECKKMSSGKLKIE